MNQKTAASRTPFIRYVTGTWSPRRNFLCSIWMSQLICNLSKFTTWRTTAVVRWLSSWLMKWDGPWEIVSNFCETSTKSLWHSSIFSPETFSIHLFGSVESYIWPSIRRVDEKSTRQAQFVAGAHQSFDWTLRWNPGFSVYWFHWKDQRPFWWKVSQLSVGISKQNENIPLIFRRLNLIGLIVSFNILWY